MSHESDEVMDPHVHDGEAMAESALRPGSLSEFAGQPRVKDQLGLVLDAARHRGSVPDHVLLSGPPGLGKTTLAMIIAELSSPIRISRGRRSSTRATLAAILSGLTEGEVFFSTRSIACRVPPKRCSTSPWRTSRVDAVVGKGPGATAIPLEIPRFTMVGATTRAGLLPGAAGPVRFHRATRLLRHRGVVVDRSALVRAARHHPSRAPTR